MAAKQSKITNDINLHSTSWASSSTGPTFIQSDLAMTFGVQIPSGPDVMLGLAGEEIHKVLENTAEQLKASDKIPCAACGRTDLMRSQLLHLSALRRGKFGYERTSCFDCLQCKGPHGNSPWPWALDGHGELDMGSAATFSPILRMTSEAEPEKHRSIAKQVHTLDQDMNWTRIPYYNGSEAENRKHFKQDSNKSWFQFALVNLGEWTTTGRSTTFHNLKDMIKRDHPGDKLSARDLRARIFGDCVSFADVVAQSILSGPCAHRAVLAMKNFRQNLAGRAMDIRWHIDAIESVFGPRRFFEYLNVVHEGVNQHFPCRHKDCQSTVPNDCWLVAWNANGTFEDPNLHQFACSFCGRQYYRTADPKHFDMWSVICPAQKIMCVQDLNMQAERRLRPESVLPRALAEDTTWTGLSRNTAFTIGDWSFFLTEWPDDTVQVLEDDLKAIWSDAKARCSAATSPEQILKNILDISKDQRQQPYFVPKLVPESVLSKVRENNQKGHKKNWSYSLLPVDPKSGQIVVPHFRYKYESGNGEPGTQTPILSSKDQCRLWCYASYAIEYALIAEQKTGQFKDLAA